MSKRMKLGGSLAQIQRLQAVDRTVCPHPGKMGFERKAAAKKQARRRGAIGLQVSVWAVPPDQREEEGVICHGYRSGGGK